MFCKRKTVLLRPRNEVLSYQRRKQEKRQRAPRSFPLIGKLHRGSRKGVAGENIGGV